MMVSENPLKRLEICRAVNVACGNPTRPMNGQVWQRFLVCVYFSPLKHQGECPGRHSAIWLFASLTHGITGDATSQLTMVGYPTGFRTLSVFSEKVAQTFLSGGNWNSGPPRQKPRLNELRYGALADSACCNTTNILKGRIYTAI